MANEKKEMDITKLNKKELTKFARYLAKVNTTIMNAITYAEEICNDEMFSAIQRLDDNEKAEFLRKLAPIFLSVSHDTSMAEPETWGADFQEYQNFGMELQEHLDKVET